MIDHQVLDDADLDAFLARAGAGLHDVAARGPIPRFEPPSRWPSAGSLVAPVAVAASIATAVVVVGGGGDDDTRTGDLPPGVAEGRYGTELPLVEVDDDDGDPSTILLRTPTGLEVDIYPAAGQTVTTLVEGVEQQAPVGGEGDVCVDLLVAGGMCGPLDVFEAMAGPRTPDGGVLVTGVPDAAAVVTYEVGDVRHWQRPVHGVAAFPYTDEVAGDAHVAALDADGSVLEAATTANDLLTPAEVAAAPHASVPTGERLPALYGVDERDERGHAGNVVRREGVDGLLGFGGPLGLQVLSGGRSDLPWGDPSGLVGIVSTTPAHVAEVTARLDPLDGAVVGQLDQPDGTVVLVWAGSGVASSRVDDVVARIAAEPDVPALVPLEPGAFAGIDADPSWVAGTPLHRALLTDPAGAVELGGDVVEVRAQRDGLGVTRLSVVVAGGGSFVVDVEPGVEPTLPGAGTRTGPGVVLWALPAGATLADLVDRIEGEVDAELLDVGDVTGVPGARLAVVRTA
jgi:hypothetical protein